MRWSRVGWALWVVGWLAACAPCVVFNTRLHAVEAGRYTHAQVGPDVVAQLNGLDEALGQGAAARMQAIFPEGYVFTWALYGLAWVEVGLREAPGSPLRVRARAEAARALKALDSAEGRAPFSAAMTPPYGAFWQGWTARVRAGVLWLTPAQQRDAQALKTLTTQCATIAHALQENPSPHLPSYPSGPAWPADTVVAVSALRACDALTGQPTHAPLLARWLKRARAAIDPSRGLLPHSVDPTTGAMIEGARGSSSALVLRFMPEVDPAWSATLYKKFRALYPDAVGGMWAGVREHPRGVDRPGDVDSGPLLLGFSGSASVVAIGAAALHGDEALRAPLLESLDAFGWPTERGGAGGSVQVKRYLGGVVPVGEAFMVWSKTARRWGEPGAGEAAPQPVRGPAVVADSWRIRWHGLSGLLAIAPWLLLLARRRRRARRARDEAQEA